MELLAVTLIIVLLAGIVIGVSTYVRLRMMKSRAESDLAVIAAMCEAFKADVGRYPTSSVYRMTSYPAYDYYAGWYELYNSSLLGSQLAGGGYLWGKLAIRTNGATSPFDACHTLTNKSVWWQISATTFTNLLNVIADPWEWPYNYYCTYPVNPTGVATTFTAPCVYNTVVLTNGATNAVTVSTSLYPSHAWMGGQVNLATFDLWSYGPNMRSCPNDSDMPGYNDDDLRNFRIR
jgi:type II secretory pathway pseudopilin PulG